MKAWRHEKLRAQKITLRARALSIDGDGFIKESLTPDEVAKLAVMPKWSLCDRNGPEIVATRRVDAERRRQELRNEIGKQQQILEHLEQQLADISQKVVRLTQEEVDAAQRIAAEARQAPKQSLESLNWNQLRQQAADLNIKVDEEDRSDVEAAIQTALNQTSQPASEDATDDE